MSDSADVKFSRAVITAAEQVKQKMAERAAVLWECDPSEVQFKDGVFYHAPESNGTEGERRQT